MRYFIKLEPIKPKYINTYVIEVTADHMVTDTIEVFRYTNMDDIDRITNKIEEHLNIDHNTRCSMGMEPYQEVLETEDWPYAIGTDGQCPAMIDGYKVFWYDEQGIKYECVKIK